MRISQTGKRAAVLGILVFLCTLILSACGQNQDGYVPGGEDKEGEEEENTITGKIIEVHDTSLLMLREEDANGGLMDTGVDGVKIYDQNKQEIKADALKPGMRIRLSLQEDSTIMERYPLGITGVQEIHILGQENDYVGLYLDIIKGIYGNDTGLNDNMRIMALDLTQVKNLSDSEKEAVRYLLGPLLDNWQKDSIGSPGSVKYPNPEVILATQEDLKEQGLLSEDGSYFTEGILIKIRTVKERKNSFTFSAKKWRSGLGANGYDNCKASFKDGVGTYELNFTWIS